MRIVIKIGTNLLTSSGGGLDTNRIRQFVAKVAMVKESGDEVILVSSGAIGAGMGKMGVSKRPDSLREKQALAAIGQPLLMEAYGKCFSEHKITLAQVLLTRQDSGSTGSSLRRVRSLCRSPTRRSPLPAPSRMMSTPLIGRLECHPLHRRRAHWLIGAQA